ncbi:hypothetical protein [Chondromyces apiculatus]|nr:hypothetical protein [Chondromyces apiculatus]
MSDSARVDDLKLHLQTLLRADDARRLPPPGELPPAQRIRESALFPPRIRARIERALADFNAHLPDFTDAELTKLTATRHARAALDAGMAALSRVDDHLHAVTGQRNPLVAKLYGVFGDNPTSFAGVLRSLSMAQTEDDTIAALPPDDDRRDLLFTPVIRDAVDAALTTLRALHTDKQAARGALSRGHATRHLCIDEAAAVIAIARQHLYANLPDRKLDRHLHDYGFRPIHTSRRRTPAATPAPLPSPLPLPSASLPSPLPSRPLSLSSPFPSPPSLPPPPPSPAPSAPPPSPEPSYLPLIPPQTARPDPVETDAEGPRALPAAHPDSPAARDEARPLVQARPGGEQPGSPRKHRPRARARLAEAPLRSTGFEDPGHGPRGAPPGSPAGDPGLRVLPA